MNNKLYFALGSVIGAIIGSVATYSYMKKKESEAYDWDDISEDTEEVTINPTIEKYDEENDIREKLLKNWNKPPIGTGSVETEAAESEHPVDSDEDEGDIYEEDTKAMEEALEAEEFYRDNKDKAPKVISAEEVGELPESFELDEWIFFTEDRVITDEDENEVEDYHRFVGSCLEDSGFDRDSDYEHIYIVSYEFMTVYSVTKYFMSFADKKEGEMKVKDIVKGYM